MRIKERYVDPARIDPRKMLYAALDSVQYNIPEVLVEPDAARNKISIAVNDKREVFETADELAQGKQEGSKDAVVVWTNLYGKDKVRVFCTTIGHNNVTVQDPQYLDLVAKGVLWATDKMDSAGKPKAGYGRQKKE